MTDNQRIPALVSIVGKSDSGKTTFIEKLVPQLVHLGYRVGTIKHDVHGFDIDHPGKDSWRHKKSGASATIISSPASLALIKDSDHDQSLDELIHFFKDMDLVLTEGYKRETKPKIEIYRPEVHSEPLCREDPHLIALVSEAEIDLGVPRFGLDDAPGVAAFLAGIFPLEDPDRSTADSL